jgi:hypothetical protein
MPQFLELENCSTREEKIERERERVFREKILFVHLEMFLLMLLFWSLIHGQQNH